MTDTQVFSTKNASKNGIFLYKETRVFLNNESGLFLASENASHVSLTITISVTKYLGVYIDQCLTWWTHVDSVLSKVRYKMYCIKRFQWISLYLFGLLYQVFIIPGVYHVFV